MLKKLASPKKKAQGRGSDGQDTAGFGLDSPKSPEAKIKSPKEKKVKEKNKLKPPKEKKKEKSKKPSTTQEVPSGDAKEVDVPTAEVKSPSPRRSLTRAFKRKTFEQDNAPEEKVVAKKSPSSPKKS